MVSRFISHPFFPDIITPFHSELAVETEETILGDVFESI